MWLGGSRGRVLRAGFTPGQGRGARAADNRGLKREGRIRRAVGSWGHAGRRPCSVAGAAGQRTTGRFPTGSPPRAPGAAPEPGFPEGVCVRAGGWLGPWTGWLLDRKCVSLIPPLRTLPSPRPAAGWVLGRESASRAHRTRPASRPRPSLAQEPPRAALGSQDSGTPVPKSASPPAPHLEPCPLAS